MKWRKVRQGSTDYIFEFKGTDLKLKVEYYPNMGAQYEALVFGKSVGFFKTLKKAQTKAIREAKKLLLKKVQQLEVWGTKNGLA